MKAIQMSNDRWMGRQNGERERERERERTHTHKYSFLKRNSDTCNNTAELLRTLC